MLTPSRVVTEAELDAELHLKAKLPSGGDYGCMCAVFDGDIVFEEPIALDDTFFYAINEPAKGDVGTMVFTGNVICTGHASISDRLMCLVVLGDFRAPKLSVYGTEMLVCGNLDVFEVQDRDAYVTVLGTRR